MNFLKKNLFAFLFVLLGVSFFTLQPTSVSAQTGCSGTCRAACIAGEVDNGPCISGGTCCAAAGASVDVTFDNPLAFDTVEGLLDNVLATLQSIIVILSIVFIVIGAIIYITSSGDEGRIRTAKSAITASMIGLALGLAAPSFLKEIGQVLGWGAVNSGPVASALTLSQIAQNVLNFLLSIVGILGVIMLVIGGLMYLTAAGDEGRIDEGKKIVQYSIIGILVSLAALVIVNQIANFFL